MASIKSLPTNLRLESGGKFGMALKGEDTKRKQEGKTNNVGSEDINMGTSNPTQTHPDEDKIGPTIPNKLVEHAKHCSHQPTYYSRKREKGNIFER